MRRHLLRVIVVVALLLAMMPAFAAEAPLFTAAAAFATKTGFRGVFSWQAKDPVEALVHYGTSPATLTETVKPLPGAPDTAGLAIADGLTIGTTYYWQVEDLITGERSSVGSFVAANAYNDWNGLTYTIDFMVQLDLESLPAEVPADQALEDIAQGVSIFAERLYDAMDGYARLGQVIVTDSELDYAGSVPFVQGFGCNAVSGAGGNLADVLVQTTVPFDSHTFSGWSIDKPCTSFYVGRLGQLVVPWEDDLHFGYVATHEMIHYAFNAPDLYDAVSGGGCRNLDWDGSLMHNSGGWNGERWELTELDRNPTLTPCDHSHSGIWTWDELRKRYVNVPANPGGPIDHIVDDQARGNADGGALDIKILDRSSPLSTLEPFIPNDSNPPPVPSLSCSGGSTVVVDRRGDATDLLLVGAGINEPALDLVEGRMSFDSVTETLTFQIEVDDLGAANPQSSPNVSYNFNFGYGQTDYSVEASRTATGTEQYVLSVFTGPVRVHLVEIAGAFDHLSNTISIQVPRAALEAAGAKALASGDVLSDLEIVSRRAAPTRITTAGPSADVADKACDFVVGTGASTPAEPPEDEVDAFITTTNPRFEWTGETLADAIIPFTGTNFSLCDGSRSNAECDRKLIHVTVPVGGDNFKVVVDTEGANSYIVYVYAPDGSLFGQSSGIGNVQEVSALADTTGVYTVVLRPFAAVNAIYSAFAQLGPDPSPVPGGSLSETTPIYSWSGDTTTDSYFVFGCSGFAGYRLSRNACAEEFIEVTVPTGSTTTVLDVTITANNPDVNDFNFDIFDPDGTRIGGSASDGTVDEHAVARALKSGVYKIQVRAWAAVDAQYHGTAVLRAEQEGDFPPEGDVDGEISVGDSFSWTGRVPLNTQPLFFCQSIAQSTCDNTYVQVNVPEGGARLTITIKAEAASDDLDVDVYGPDGSRLTQLEGRTSDDPEVVELNISAPGVYRIAVVGILAVDGGYQGTVSLEAT